MGLGSARSLPLSEKGFEIVICADCLITFGGSGVEPDSHWNCDLVVLPFGFFSPGFDFCRVQNSKGASSFDIEEFRLLGDQWASHPGGHCQG